MTETSPHTTTTRGSERQRAISDELFAAFDSAQRRAITIARDVVGQLAEGQSERDVARMLEERAGDAGFTGWFHRPHVRFGAPVRPGRSRLARRRLRAGDIVEIDLGPATDEAFADFGTALAFGTEDEPPLVSQARQLCKSACGFSSRWKCTGEVYVYAQAWANNRGLSLGDERSIGHSCLAPGSAYGMAWPRAARAAILLRRNQVQWFNPRRMHGFFALQPRLVDGDSGCSFEEMVLIDGDTKRLVGRDSDDDLGTL